MASKRNGALYTGTTSDLIQRAAQHREGTFGGWSASHGTTLLVYYERQADMTHAILREKEIKKWRRKWKLELIERGNPEWRDLYDTLF